MKFHMRWKGKKNSFVYHLQLQLWILSEKIVLIHLRKYVELGLGVSFVPMSSWRGLFHDSVVLRRIAGLRRRTYAFMPRGSHCKRSASEFVRILLEQISNDAED